nr:MAG TPA: hypothetical protein [Caudoviricetes sp.]
MPPIIFPCLLRFFLRFGIGRGWEKRPFLFPFGWKVGVMCSYLAEYLFNNIR